MQASRSAFLGQKEFPFSTWHANYRLQCPPKSNFPQDLPTIIGFRIYTALKDGMHSIGQLHGLDRSQFESEEEEEELARQEYFYSQAQLDTEANNIIFATASSGEFHTVVRVEDIPRFIIEHKECIIACLNAAVDYLLVKTFLDKFEKLISVQQTVLGGQKPNFSEAREGVEQIIMKAIESLSFEALETRKAEILEAKQMWVLVADECRLRDVYVLDALVRLGLEDGRTLSRTMQDIGKEFSSFGPWLNLEMFPRRMAPSVGAVYAVHDVPAHEDTIASLRVTDVIVLQEVYANLLLVAFRLGFEHQSEMFSTAFKLYGPLSEGIQVKGSIVLYEMTKNGIAIDRTLAKKVSVKLEQRLNNAIETLMKDDRTRAIFHLSVSPDGNLYATREGAKPKIDTQRLEELLAETIQEITSKYSVDMVIPRIAGGGLSRAPRTWSEYSHLSEFLKTWIDMEQAAHFNAFLSHLSDERAHPQYTIMVRNGRTSAQNPPIQQTPRKGGYREMFRAKQGHVLVAIDYEFIELCTLAAVCLARYGNSVLAQVISQGVDPHAFTASMIEGVSLHAFMAWKTSPDPALRAKFSSLRQRAKAVNFGIPSGLTAAGLSLYAKGAYGVDLSVEDAETFRSTLINNIYPELAKYLEDGDMERLAANLNVSLKYCWSTFSFSKDKRGANAAPAKANDRNEAVEGGLRNIVRGKKFRKRDGKEYNPYFVKKVWSGLKKLARDPRLFQMVHEAQKDNQGSEELYKELFGRPVVTLTGRVRGKVGFTQACNTPFSGLAADGAKLALWNLYLLGYTVVGFIHDEILLEIPETPTGTYDEVAAEIRHIVIQSMRELTGPVPVGCQLSVSYVWSKDAHAVYNTSGQLIPWISEKDPTETS